MNKKELTEADIRTKFITAALTGALREKWNLMTQIREEAYFTKGRVIVRGKTVHRGEAKKADYILSYKPNLPIAVIEAKDNNHSVGADMQQALEYAEILDVPFAYSSNGDAFLEHDRTVTSGTVTREIPLDQFPSSDELWARYCKAKGYTGNQESVATQDYYDNGSRKSPRYYQLIAINRTVDASRVLSGAWVQASFSGGSLILRPLVADSARGVMCLSQLRRTIGESGPQRAGSQLLTRLFGSKHFVDFD